MSSQGAMKAPKRGSVQRANSMQTPDKPGWLCLRADCQAAQRKIPNYHWRTTCFDCCRSKSTAMSPPLASCVPWAVRKDTTAPQADKGEKPPKEKKEAGAPPPAPAAMVSSSNAEAKVPRWTKLSLTDGETESVKDIVPAAVDVIQSIAGERMPTGPDDLADASAVFARLTEAITPCASVTKKRELDAEIQSLLAARLSLRADRDASLIAAIDSRLAEATEQKERLSKKSPSNAALASALKEARSSYERGIQDRKDRVVTGLAKAKERQVNRKQMIGGLREQLDRLEAIIGEKEEEAGKAFAALGAAQDSLEATVLELFDTKIHGLDDVSMTAIHVGTPSDHNALLSSTEAAGDTMHLSQDPKAAGIAMQAKLQEMQQELQRSLEALAAQKEALLAENAFNATMDNLPVPTAVTLESDNDRSAASLWHFFLQSWSAAGGVEHFTVASVASHVQGSERNAVDFFRRLIGEDTWDRWKPLKQMAKDHAVLPRQLAMLAQDAILKLKAHHDQMESIRAAAESSFTQVTAQNKKRRAAQSGDPMTDLI